jgi:hypothetical protein
MPQTATPVWKGRPFHFWAWFFGILLLPLGILLLLGRLLLLQLGWLTEYTITTQEVIKESDLPLRVRQSLPLKEIHSIVVTKRSLTGLLVIGHESIWSERLSLLR